MRQDLMEKGNMARPTEMNLSQVDPTDEPPLRWGLASIILVSFLVGAAMNGHIFWLLCVKMKRTVNTIWFLHLTLSYLVSCSCLPFFVVQDVLNFRWVFGPFLCRAVNFCIAVGMLTPVFLLTIISLDRYLITCHPVWSRRNRTKPRARRVLAGVWTLSVVMSIPYLVSYVIQGDKKEVCMKNFAFFIIEDKDKAEALHYKIDLAVFVVRLLLTFLFPFFIIVGCYHWMCQEIKKKKLARRAGKPFQVLVVSVACFFIFRLPFYLYYALSLLHKDPRTVEVLRIIFSISLCLNICLTPILYLFVGEKFKQVFRTSTVVLLKKGFIMPIEDTNAGEESGHMNDGSSMQMMPVQWNNLASP
uniref:Probable G-protein coupled receptor 33 n=1 Tax=Podarcis muralis TaxID=64176 RepID=A0A670IHF2_PODMU|nr:probable G-protein coupled receptor 33 [Podarcis muralis]